jgi:uncharacterized protein YggU (UPF0235/DUF167 family)
MAKKFTDGKSGAALTIRVTPRADKDELVEILRDQTIKVRLTCSADDMEINDCLLAFLSSILDLSPDKMEIVAGLGGRDKLVSIVNTDAQELHEIIRNLIP